MNGSSSTLQLLQPRSHGQPQHRGVYLRRRIERFGRNREQILNPRIELRCGRQQAVVARAGRGRYAVGHFALHHDDRALDAGMQTRECARRYRR